MELRVLLGALAIALVLFGSVDARAQTDTPATPETTTPEAASPAAPDGAPPVDQAAPAAPEGEAAPPLAVEGEAPPAAAEQEQQVPPVEVVQPKPRPAPRAAPAPRPVAAPVEPRPAPIEPAIDLPSEITEPPPGYFGPPGGVGNFGRMMESSQSPIVPTQGIVPGDLSDFSSAGSRVTRQKIDEQDPLTTNDIVQTVPGVAIVNDDGLGRHGGIGIRGSPTRRSRKVAVLEDGRFINQSIWLDPSTHYVPPPDRLESVEVLRGTVITYGPNNNHGVVNFRNIQPFGPNETVVMGQGGPVGLTGGVGEERSKDLDDGDAAKWHVHTRQTSGDWGLVLSYSGANAKGAWDTERLRFNDFYGALGWKGEQSDFTFSTVYFVQRDNYDESNFEGEDEDPLGLVEREFFKDIKHCKSCFNPASTLNEYNADILLMQGIYNYYVNQDTTVSARVYGQLVDRARFFNLEGGDPRAAETNFKPIIDGDEVLVPEDAMEGRLRTFNHIGTELRTELANRPFLFGLSQDLQAGVRYEHHVFLDTTIIGRQGQVLDGFDNRGLTIWDREFEADAFSAFLQTDIPLTERLNLVPGARLEHYRISRLTNVLTGENAEEECEEFDDEECIVFEDFTNDPFTEDFDRTHVLPGVAFAWGFGRKDEPVDYGSKSLKPADTKPSYFTTLYGGYHRGLTMNVLREAPFPPGNELGDNYQLGVRSTAIKGVTFDVAGFHQRIQDFQVKGEISLAADKTFGVVDEVEINGVEAYGRLDTRPYTGWRLNPYAEASYTLADSVIEEGFNEDGVSVAGNLVPEVPDQTAYLTAGIESTAGWNASVSWIYRGAFFTDVDNTPFGGDPEGENGEVPSVWLLAARANYTIPGTDAVIFISGENLTNKLYITDREDGLKPGIGRTIMAGGRIKW